MLLNYVCFCWIMYFQVAISLILAWFITFILTATNVITSDSSSYGYEARTDIKLQAVVDVSWFQISYPGKW